MGLSEQPSSKLDAVTAQVLVVSEAIAILICYSAKLFNGVIRLKYVTMLHYYSRDVEGIRTLSVHFYRFADPFDSIVSLFLILQH
jgi:hypothetical protein